MAEQLKLMYSKAFIQSLSEMLKKSDANFDKKSFINQILDKEWADRELKARGLHIANKMHDFLPYSFDKQISILNKVAPEFTGYTATIFPTFVEIYGLEDEVTSLKALENYTQYSTSEFAIRPFLLKDPNLIEQLYDWAHSENYHVRRLASEGCRPLLPWARKLQQYITDPQPLLPILDKLKNDQEDYVYRSVANNWNDISKNHPELVLKNVKEWMNDTKTTKWVAKHALRTLLKKGNQEAMSLFGFGQIDKFELKAFTIKDEKIEIGNDSQLNISFKNHGPIAKYRLEYAVDYLKKNGSHNRKVFQLSELTLEQNQTASILKNISFKELSTRKHYSGLHFVNFVVNGNDIAKIPFELT